MGQEATAVAAEVEVRIEIQADGSAVVEEPEPIEIYYVEENGKHLLESEDLYACLRKSRELRYGAKVKRRSDGALLAYRTKSCLTDTELAADAVSEDPEVQNATSRRKKAE